MTLVTSILTGAPLWVWPLLALLIFFGAKATKTRTVPAWPVYLLPLLGLLAVNSVRGVSPSVLTWGLFGVAYFVGGGVGFRYQNRIILEKSGSSVTFKGEWVTFVVLMVVFWLNFTAGTVKVVSPEFYTTQVFRALFACVAGLASGSFIGRALATLKSR